MALILVIEDDTTQRFAAKFSLQKAGHDVLEALDGVQGLALARERKPDVVVCDVVMPRMDGYQVLDELRRDSRIGSTPVLLLTALDAREDVRKGMKSGADDYLTKPFKFAELVEAVQGLVDKRIQRESRAARTAMAALDAAMAAQKHELTLRYEVQMLNELNERWSRKERATEQLSYPDAVLLLAIVYPDAIPANPSTEEANDLREAYRHAKDQLKLFRAQHVLPWGNDLLGVFTPQEAAARDLDEEDRSLGAMPALRACEALARTPCRQVLTRGAVSLVQVADALHGGPDVQLAGGEALSEALALREVAVARGSRVLASPALAAQLAQARGLSAQPLVHEGRSMLSVA